jgi:cytochrome c553
MRASLAVRGPVYLLAFVLGASGQGLAATSFVESNIAVNTLAGNSEAGALKADDERCRECHVDQGDVGGDNESMKVPRLAGQQPLYLLKQLQDFAKGARKHEFMNRVAADLDPLDAADIIAYYVSRTPNRKVLSQKQSAEGAGAQQLFLHGDPARSIPSCASCHGDDGKTAITQPELVAAEWIPVIAGQDRHYLEEQLFNWRSGARRNSPDGMMNRALQGLTDAEIHALAIYLEGL